MDAFKESGVFWLPDNPDQQLTGELVFDPDNGTMLSLVTTLDEWHSRWPENPSVILGTAGKYEVTLLGTHRSNYSTSSSGVTNENFRSNELLIGHHFTSESEVMFTSAAVRYYDLGAWIDRRGGTETIQYANSTHGDFVEFRYENPATPEQRFEGGVVSVRFSWSRKYDAEEWSLSHYPSICFQYDEPVGRETILDHVAYIRNLITLCTNTPAAVRNVTLYNHDVHIQMINGRVSKWEQPIDYRAPFITTPAAAKKNSSPYRSADLDFETIGGISTVARWVDIANKYRPVVNLLTAVRSGMSMYAENRFLNIINAAEAFHRIRYGGTQIPEAEYKELEHIVLASTPDQHRTWLSDKFRYLNQPTLRKRLDHLAVETGPITDKITGKTATWAQTIALTRNGLTHYNKDHKDDFSGDLLHWLGESVYYVLRVSLLRECVDDARRLAKLAPSDGMSFFARRVSDSLTEAGAVIGRRSSRH